MRIQKVRKKREREKEGGRRGRGRGGRGKWGGADSGGGGDEHGVLDARQHVLDELGVVGDVERVDLAGLDHEGEADLDALHVRLEDVVGEELHGELNINSESEGRVREREDSGRERSWGTTKGRGRRPLRFRCERGGAQGRRPHSLVLIHMADHDVDPAAAEEERLMRAVCAPPPASTCLSGPASAPFDTLIHVFYLHIILPYRHAPIVAR